VKRIDHSKSGEWRCVLLRVIIHVPLVPFPRYHRLFSIGNTTKEPSFISAINVWLLRDAMLARYMLSSCVCPSVRLSHAGIMLVLQLR